MNCDKCLNKGDCEDCAQVPMAEIPEKQDLFFHVGEIVTLKSRLFKVKSVKPKEIRLKLWINTINTPKTPREKK